MKTNKNLLSHIRRNYIFGLLLVVFVVLAGHYALTNPLNLTPDEAYHFDAIQAYAQQYSPFIHHQTTADVAATNDMVRYPSYLYHYLMSFPYRLLDSLHVSDHSTLIALRLITVSLGIITLVLLRKLLGRIASRRWAELGTAVFALLPMTLLVFGGLNYDTLMWPIIFGTMLLLFSLRKQASVAKILGAVSLLAAGCLTQYSFAPIALVASLYLAILVGRQLVDHRLQLKPLRFSWKLVAVSALCLVSVGLFAERYGVNTVVYHTITPSCQAVHPLEDCLQNPIAARNYNAAHGPQVEQITPVTYVQAWIKLMVNSLPHPQPANWLHLNYVIFAFISAGLVATLAMRNRVFKQHGYGRFVIIASLVYVGTVLANNYCAYLQFHHIWAVNGRYLLPAIPFLVILFAGNIQLATSHIWAQAKRLRTLFTPPELPTWQRYLTD